MQVQRVQVLRKGKVAPPKDAHASGLPDVQRV